MTTLRDVPDFVFRRAVEKDLTRSIECQHHYDLDRITDERRLFTCPRCGQQAYFRITM